MSSFTKPKFEGNILILGCGAICSCALPILLETVEVDTSKITVVDMIETRKDLIASSIAKGVKFLVFHITPENRSSFLSQFLKKGDFLLDLAWEIDTCEQLQWCRENGVLFLNTSLEVWNPVGDALENNPPPIYRTLFQRHRALREMVAAWPPLPSNAPGPTTIYEHGANPGLVSYLTQKALYDLSQRLIQDPNVDSDRKVKLQAALDQDNYAQLCYLSGTKVIHISERDTQVRYGNFYELSSC